MVTMKAGAEADSFCTNCKMVLAHTVIAVWENKIKRVRCNTCMREHAYRKADPSTGKPVRAARASSSTKAAASTRRASSSKQAKANAGVVDYDALMAGKDPSTARRYSPRERLSPGDLIDHPTFGLGVVAATRGIDKLDCAFPNGAKTLVHGKGAPPGSPSRS